MSPYRTSGEIEIPPPRAVQLRRSLALAIVAPVRGAQWFWGRTRRLLVMNAALNVILIGPWVQGPREPIALFVLAVNVIGVAAWGGVKAYRWAVRVLAAPQDQAKGES